ncbi:hypothetical protein Taro_032964 [Colocasia esculenta]|uniref:Transcription factor GAMYB n=1 Tax=Colocasia esculenta TaxID=4460 RepID=A0A843VWE2_COLES|nr:hypothetical protein [Colocasia esculenta]
MRESWGCRLTSYLLRRPADLSLSLSPPLLAALRSPPPPSIARVSSPNQSPGCFGVAASRVPQSPGSFAFKSAIRSPFEVLLFEHIGEYVTLVRFPLLSVEPMAVLSLSIDENSCKGTFSAGDGSMKKGPWTSSEDAILIDYVKKHGEGNWNAVQKRTGLSRCGKSCRLRWTNHLRPDLKKGALTSDEEDLIIKLHSKMGNRWAKMAAHLPGRTDNEIKNYWNTRIKRLQRAGLPIYPQNVSFQSLHEKQSPRGCEFALCDKQQNELLQLCSYDTQDVTFDHFKVNQGTSSHTQPFPHISVSANHKQGLGSKNCDAIFSAVNDASLPISSSKRIHRPFGMGFPRDPDPGSENRTPIVGVVSGSHALPNGNFFTSQTLPVAVKLELPSLQYPETDLSRWPLSPSTPPSEAADVLAETPSVSVCSDCVSTRSSGLLEASLHEARAKASAENKLSQKKLTSSTTMMNNLGESSAFNLRDMYCGDSRGACSPLGSSVFSAYTHASISSLDGSSPGNTSDDLNGKLKHVEYVAHQDGETGSAHGGLFHHDAPLKSDWCHNASEVHTTIGNAIPLCASSALNQAYLSLTCASIIFT